MQSWFTPLEWVLWSSPHLHNCIFSTGLPSNVQLLSVSFYPCRTHAPSSTHYLFNTYYLNPELHTKFPSSFWQHPRFPHCSIRVCDINESPLTSTCREAWHRHNHRTGGKSRQSKREAAEAAALSYPLTWSTNLSPLWLTVFMDTNNPTCYREPQLVSAVVANPRPLLQNWPQVCLGGDAEMRNREPHGKLGTLGFGWRAKAQTRLFGKKWIKQTPPPKTTWLCQESFTTYMAWLR